MNLNGNGNKGLLLALLILLVAIAQFQSVGTSNASRSVSSRYVFLRFAGFSMQPTIHNRQLLRVDKAAYGRRNVARGDIVVFRASSAGQPHLFFIKRVVGLPGEMVEVNQGSLYINRRPVKEPYVLHPAAYSFSSRWVPSRSYFVLGDNRSNSFDSSKWAISPWLARKDIVGKVTLH